MIGTRHFGGITAIPIPHGGIGDVPITAVGGDMTHGGTGVGISAGILTTDGMPDGVGTTRGIMAMVLIGDITIIIIITIIILTITAVIIQLTMAITGQVQAATTATAGLQRQQHVRQLLQPAVQQRLLQQAGVLPLHAVIHTRW